MVALFRQEDAFHELHHIFEMILLEDEYFKTIIDDSFLSINNFINADLEYTVCREILPLFGLIILRWIGLNLHIFVIRDRLRF